jgi:Ca-activated chloride channel homolog
MTFANLEFLVVGGVLALGVAWWTFRRRPTAGLRVSDGRAVRSSARRGLARLWRLPDVLRLAAVAALVVALARPQSESLTELTGEGADIMIALDMSGSMNAVDMTMEDLLVLHARGAEPLNRFAAAREIIKDFVASRREDRIGLIIFGPEVYLKFPLTLDYPVILAQLDELVLDSGVRGADGECTNACTISGAGTALGDALARAYRRLRHSKAETRAILFITDGEREGGKLCPRMVAEYMSDQPDHEQMRVYTFLVGSASGEGTLIPRYVRAHDRHQGWIPVQARDEYGRAVYEPSPQAFPTDPQLLKDIAQMTGGQYFEAFDERQFREQFEVLAKTEFRTTTRTHTQDLFWPWLLAGLGIILCEWLLRVGVMRKFP